MRINSKLLLVPLCCGAMLLNGCGLMASDGGSPSSQTSSQPIVHTTQAAERGIPSGEFDNARTFDDIVEIISSHTVGDDYSAVIGNSIEFTGKPNAADSSADELVFSSRVPRYKLYAPVSGYNGVGEVTVIGRISSVDYATMRLEYCEIVWQEQPAETTATTTTTVAITTTATSESVVYVSNTGKYHKYSDCSGMTEYIEMSLSDAQAANYDACGRCY